VTVPLRGTPIASVLILKDLYKSTSEPLHLRDAEIAAGDSHESGSLASVKVFLIRDYPAQAPLVRTAHCPLSNPNLF